MFSRRLLVVGLLCVTPAFERADSSSLVGVCKDTAAISAYTQRQNVNFITLDKNERSARDFAAVDEENVYSPSVVEFNNDRYVFFGGWHARGQTHDSIYFARCPNPERQCDPEVVALDSEKLGFEHLNDPAVLRTAAGQWLMYMTGVKKNEDGLKADHNHVYLSISGDFRDWTRPVEIASDIWLPAAVITKAGNILLYGNGNASGSIVVYTLSKDGVTILSRQIASMPKFYSNLDVRWIASVGTYQMLAETAGLSNQIDLLSSDDGLKWSIERAAIIKPHLGKNHVRTPAFDITNKNTIYYGETGNRNSTGNKICVRLLN
jgi:hypothetical protein